MTASQASDDRSRELEAEQATELGVLKAFHLVQYAKVARTRSRPSVLAQRDARIGKPARRLSAMDASMRIDKNRGVLRLEVKLSDLVE